MASSIVVPTIQDLGNYPPKIAQKLIDVATQAQTDINSSNVSGAMISPVANIAALKAVVVTSLTTGTLCLVESDNTGMASLWMYSSTSSATDTSNLLITPPTAGSGAWLNQSDRVALKLAIGFATADAAVLFTVPTGVRLRPKVAWWDVTTSWTGGTSSAIGVKSSVSGFSTAGDILGGASGDVAATLVSTNTRMVGTIGAQLSSTSRLILVAADTISFDRITSAFTAGAGYVRLECDVLANPGA